MKNITRFLCSLMIGLTASMSLHAQVINTIAGTGTGGWVADGVPAISTPIFNPAGVFVDASKNIYFADFSNHRIRKIDPSGIITTIAGKGTPGYAGDGAAATAATINHPVDLLIDNSGNVIFCDYSNHAIRKISTTGIITTICGDGTSGFSGDGFAATGARLSFPEGICMDLAGNIYIADANNQRIRRINTSGIISTYAGSGFIGFFGDGGPASSARFTNPFGIATDIAGNLYIADQGNHRIRMVNSSGVINTIAGNGTPTFFGDGGSALTASLNTPTDIAVDPAGNNIYIADRFNYCVRKVTGGVITTVAGTGGVSGFFGDGGLATAAQCSEIPLVFADPAGDVYIPDFNNNRLRLVNNGNHIPHFTGGKKQSITVCHNVSPVSLNSLLAVIDTEVGQTLTWTLFSSPLHGVASVSYTTTSTGATVTPTGLTFTPTTGYRGLDSFMVKVNDGISIDTTKIYVTIDSLPAIGVIKGPTTVCEGATMTLSDDSTGGVWSASNGNLTIVGSTGFVTGVTAGYDTISYTITNTCGSSTVLRIDTVNVTPAPISGTKTVCVGSSTILTDTPPGGVWSSSNTTVATVATGTVSGLLAGTTTITYSVNRCHATTTVTVFPLPSNIIPSTPVIVCVGKPVTLSDATPSGTWSSSNTTRATITSGGVVSGVAVGTATISYTDGLGCSATKTVTVNTDPGPISPSGMTICSGHGGLFSDATGGGTWSSSNTTVATIGTSGAVTGVAGGSATITYTVGGCFSIATVTVNQSPADISPTSAVSVCVGNTFTLSDATAGGTWSSNTTSVASIGTGGVITGAATGTATISYTTSLGCFKTKSVTVISGVAAISPLSPSVCTGSTTALTDATGGGAWSSTNTTVATIGTGGIVTGVATGTSTISYTIGACFAVTTITVNLSPSAITAAAFSICYGNSITLSSATGSGTWSSSATTIALIGSSSGTVSGGSSSAGGTTVITYRTLNGCTATQSFTVNPVPLAISGTLSVCTGQTTALTDATPSGTWSSANTSVATVSGIGVVSGVAASGTTISYTLSTGCYNVVFVAVNQSPPAILPSGSLSICSGNSIALSNTTSGGAWSSSATTIAIVGTTGLVAGTSVGVVDISYTIPATGCYALKQVSVTAGAGAITPSSVAVCAGSTVSLSSPTGGGVWSSASTATATVSSGGIVTGVATGVTNITYTAGGCYSIATVTVLLAPGTITGFSSICQGGADAFSDAPSGGTWSSSNTTIVLISPTFGNYSANGAGTATITYTLSSGCRATHTITVHPLVGLGFGSTVCQGSTITLTGVTGAAWGSSNTAVATVNSSGVVTGLSAGSSFISYITPFGCGAVTTVTVNPLPSAITPSGSVSVCAGSTTALSSSPGGGTWSSTNTALATVGTSGVVSGVSAGVVNISYTNSFGCAVGKSVTVNIAPAAIVPSSPVVCIGGTTTLSDAVGGGAWSSSATSVATINSGGMVTGVATGTATITYAIASCRSTTVVTVNPLPAAITPSGAVSVCMGSTTNLSDATVGGTWSSGATGIATVGTAGVVTGVSAGTVSIFYSNSFGCSVSKSVTVNITPVAITPVSTNVCPGSTVALTDATTGGVWSSSNTTLATIGSTGIVSGVASGSLTITYTLGSCRTTSTVTVNLSPVAGTISGPLTVCAGSSISLTDAAAGGVWSSSSTSVATVGSTGVVSALSGGTTTITYAVTNGCGTARAFATVTVNTAPTAGTILGPSSICAGTFVTLSDASLGGTYSLSGSGATVTSGGLLTGVSVGTVTITYTVTTPCGTASTTKTVSVGAFLTAGTITGAGSVCAASTITLSDPATGGIWSSSATSVATVGTSGIVTGVGAGTTTISYTVTASCGSASATHTVLVNPLPNAGSIIGASILCAGMTTTYSNGSPGGLWTVTNPVATITGTGLLTGITPGLDTIRYTVTNSCGVATATKTVTIGAFITGGTITGPTSVCAGSSVALSSTASGGMWTTSNTNATVGSISGTVTGLIGGVDTIYYTVTSSCGSTSSSRTVTIIPLPVAGSISGPSNVCVGTTITLTNSTGGGVWSASNANATITGGGVVTAITPGVDTILYTVTSVCGTAVATKIINVGFMLTAGTITGPSSVCAGSSITMSDSSPFGMWSSGNTSIAVVGTTGIVTGVSAGVDTIYYTVSNVCGTVVASTTVTVNPLANPGSISGPGTLCLGTPATYTNSVSGGTWSLLHANATITSGGLVTPLAIGSNIVSYSVTNGCGTMYATMNISLNTSPVAGPITGATSICVGSSSALTNSVSGGYWTSGNTAVATVGTTGVVAGIGMGTATIYYQVNNGCGISTATTVVTTNLTPVAGAIVGPSGICAGTFTIYTNAATGGVWSVTNPAATITPGGVLTAITPFTVDTIRYTVTNGCGTAIAIKVINIGAFFSAGTITGPANVCTGTTITLTSTVAGGTWSSSNASATIGSGSGIVTGVNPGVDTIYYVITGSCGVATAMTTVTVSNLPNPGVITGPSSVCTGSSITVSNAVTGGMWSMSNSNATITSGGVINGITTGLDTIRYSVPGACGVAIATKIISINTIPGAGTIIGASTLCAGTSVTLSNTVGSGIWSSSNTAVASVGTSGVVTGISGGVNTISYTVSNSCGTVSATKSMTVSPLPNAGSITGPDSLCVGDIITLVNSATGGVWSAGNGNATVSGSGVVTGVANGTTPISYTVTNSCGTVSVVKVVTIGILPSAGVISGPSSVCVGSGITLTNPVPGGVWLTSNANASIVGPGIVYGVTVGIDTIFYMVTNFCGTKVASKIIPVNPVPFVAPISGATSVCVGSLSTLSNMVPGGIWISSTPAVAAIGLSSGIVSGLTPGTSTITYTVTNAFGCPTSVTVVDTVVSAPGFGAITGSASVCAGSAVILTSTDPGGAWSSGNTSVVTIDAGTGVLTGVAGGTATISYTSANMCGAGTVTRTETVNALPVVAAIAGTSDICIGSGVSLTNATAGGTWSSSNTSVATIGTSGVVMGMATGTATITYTVTNVSGCTSFVTLMETIHALPTVAGISGITHECIGATTILANATPGGVWSSSNTSVATVGSSSGIVAGVAVGTAFIAYTVTNVAGCSASVAVEDTVLGPPVVAAIAGPASVCAGASVTLTDATPGGVWSATNANATVSGGLVTGMSAGLDTIVYAVSNTCGTSIVTTIMTINTVPTVGAITGAANVCIGTTTTLTNGISGGSWSTSDITVNVDPVTGIVTGVSAGTAAITYTVFNVCGAGIATKIVTVNVPPVAGTITGASNVCPGGTMTLASSVPGGVWSSSNARATVIGGLVTGVIPGLDTIMYSVSNLCGTATASKVITVSPFPNAGTIYGPSSVCMGSQINVTDAAVGGIWSTSNNLIATVNPYGVVTPVSPGMVNIIYSLTAACGPAAATHAVSVISLTDCNHGTSGVGTTTEIVELKIYPNPNNGTFIMNLLSDRKEPVQVTITNVVGQKVSEFTATTNNDIEVKLDQPAGIYILSATSGNKKYIEKVTIR